MNICKCHCHVKDNKMYCMDIPCGCCNKRGMQYLDTNLNLLPEMVDVLVQKSIDDWKKYRKANFIEI